MKLDNFLRIEPMTVYRGRTPVLKEEIRRLYGSSQVSVVDLNIFSEKNSFARIRQFLDMFALPEMTLLCDCTQVDTVADPERLVGCTQILLIICCDCQVFLSFCVSVCVCMCVCVCS
jgi:hypothetical protein